MYTNKNKQITNSTQYRETFLNINDNKLIVQKYITIFQRLEDIQPTGFKPPNIPSKVEASDVNQKSFERMSHVKCRIKLRKIERKSLCDAVAHEHRYEKFVDIWKLMHLYYFPYILIIFIFSYYIIHRYDIVEFFS